MKVTSTLKQKLRKYTTDMNIKFREFRKGMDENASIACEVAEYTIKEKTPHIGDGKRRGLNMITNSLQKAWKVDLVTHYGNSRKGIFAEIVITNDKPYAPYVQYGHRLTRHFVPWLYKDSVGTLSKMVNPNLGFWGLVVGTKTTFVEGIDMIGPGKRAFLETFNRLNKKLHNQLFKGGNGD